MLALGALLLAAPAHAESAFLLAYPPQTGSVPAAAYGDDGLPFGQAHLAMEKLEEGWLRVAFEAGRADGAHMRATALLEPVEPGKTLRLYRQQTESFDLHGHSVGRLQIDHRARRASCLDPDGALVEQVELPPHDRVVNVPMNLLFLPLVRGDRETLEFEVFLCHDGARRVDFQAWVEHGNGGRRIEVRYGPDLGPFLSTLARGFAPRLAFWFEPSAPYAWQAHRVPLYMGGPEVTVVRDGLGVDSLE